MNERCLINVIRLGGFNLIYRMSRVHAYVCVFFFKKNPHSFLELKYQLCDYFVRIKRAALYKVNKTVSATYRVRYKTVMAHI